jgi:hypothetical protein
MAQRRQHVHDKGYKQGDGKRGNAHDKGLCSPDSWPKKGRAFTRRWRAQCVGADGEPELGVRSSGQRYGTIARQGSARGDDSSGTYKATGSARWPALKRRRVCAATRCGTAGNTQTASSQGSVQPRLEGRVHSKVKGSVLTSRSGHSGEEVVTSSVERPGAEEAGRRGPWLPHRRLPCAAARSLAFRRGGVEELGEEETDRGGVVLGGSSPGLTTTTAPANGDGNKATSTQSRLDIGGAQVVRRPPQHPSGEGEGSPALGAAAGWWRRGAQPKSRGSARCGSRPERLRLGRRRRPSAAQADGAAVQAPSPPSLPVFFFTNGDTVAPARRRSPRTTAAPGFSPASCASFLPPPLLPPSDFGGGGGFRGNPQGGGAVQGDAGWGGFL